MINKLKVYGKLKLNKNTKVRLIAVSMALTIASGLLSGCSDGKSKYEDIVVPEGYDIVLMDGRLSRGENLDSIAEMYYDDSYDTTFSGCDDYCKYILYINNIKNDKKINAGEALEIPVFVDKNNEHYIKITEIKTAIDEIKKEQYWVKYEVVLGDSLSSLASRASGDISETYTIVEEIKERNNLKGETIREGDTIYIVNPKLGPLRIELNEENEKLEESLTSKKVKSFG